VLKVLILVLLNLSKGVYWDMKSFIKSLEVKILQIIKKRRGPVVTVVRLSGVIGGMGGLRQGLSLSSIEKVLERAFSPSKLSGVAIVINSPGGSPVQSDLIAGRIRVLSQEKEVPVFTFVEDVAASGGYWLACAGDEIYASVSSILGSIGVISGGFGYTELIRKLGIERRLHTSGDKKGMLDPFSPEKPSDLKHLKTIQEEIHNDFINMVKLRRKDRLKGQEKVIFSGSFWGGKKALEMGLIDGLGDLRSVIREKFGEDVKIKVIKENRSYLKKRLGLAGQSLSISRESDIISHLISNLIITIDERAMWNRFGL